MRSASRGADACRLSGRSPGRMGTAVTCRRVRQTQRCCQAPLKKALLVAIAWLSGTNCFIVGAAPHVQGLQEAGCS